MTEFPRSPQSPDAPAPGAGGRPQAGTPDDGRGEPAVPASVRGAVDLGAAASRGTQGTGGASSSPGEGETGAPETKWTGAHIVSCESGSRVRPPGRSTNAEGRRCERARKGR